MRNYNFDCSLAIVTFLTMSECVIDIKIGVDGSEAKELYRAVDLTVEMHQEKVNSEILS